MSKRLPLIAVSLICLVTVVRIALTHSVFSPTSDEATHVVSGWEWLTLRRCCADVEHPPLARIVFALPFRSVHVTPPTAESVAKAGNNLYAATGDYLHAAAVGRRGNLLFVLFALIGVTLWARELFGTTVAVIVCGVFAMLPPILAHGGLATTDMACTAAFAMAMFVLERWLQEATWPRTFGLAMTLGLGLLTKFSFPVFFGACSLVAIAVKRRFPVLKGMLALALALLILWGVYFFQYAAVDTVDHGAPQIVDELFGSAWLASMPVPAPAFIEGLLVLLLHNREGHDAYLFGRVSENGWWYYFPVVLLLKSPIPLLILAIAGGWLTIRRREHPELLLYAAAILGISVTSRINIGVRHILPIYVPLSILAALAIHALWFTRGRVIIVALCGWLVVGSALAHPDYLPWMNAFAGPHPERVLIDSNLDWGQDLIRLRHECRRRRIERLGVFLFGSNDPDQIGLPPAFPIDPWTPAEGWIAISESALQPELAEDPDAFDWLTEGRSYERIGRSIRLYHVEN
jgi:4-amino-4-deoxy-L-arabinose transferase-like glycosyltransferase